MKLSGYVYDDQGNPVGGATVTVHTVDSSNNVNQTPVQSTTSSAGNGYWSFTSLPAGRYAVKVSYGGQVRWIMPKVSIQATEIVGEDGTTAPLPNASVTSGHLKDGSVTSSKLSDASVSTSKLVDRSVTEPKLAYSSVGTNQIINNAVTYQKLSSDLQAAIDSIGSGGGGSGSGGSGSTSLPSYTGSYIVGSYVGGTSTFRSGEFDGFVVTGTWQTIPGCSLNVGAGTYLVVGSATFAWSSGSEGYAVALGLEYGGTKHEWVAIKRGQMTSGTASNDYDSISGVWLVTLPSGGTINLRTMRTSSGGTIRCANGTISAVKVS